MALLKIEWTATAIKQRNYIFKYWNERNKSRNYSQKLNNKVKELVHLLKSNPNLGKQTEYKNTRVVALGNFSLFYKKIDDRVVITAFWDNRQNPMKLLNLLKRG